MESSTIVPMYNITVYYLMYKVYKITLKYSLHFKLHIIFLKSITLKFHSFKDCRVYSVDVFMSVYCCLRVFFSYMTAIAGTVWL